VRPAELAGDLLARPGLWQDLAYGYGLVVALTIGVFITRIPLQLSDSLLVMTSALEAGSWWSLVEGRLHSDGYFRPLHWLQVRILMQLSGGWYFWVFKVFQALQVGAVLVLFVRLLRITTIRDLSILPLAAAVLIGSHTFLGTVWEAFPVNHYLEIVLAVLAAANLAWSRGGPAVAVGAVAILAASLLTLESGVLVWVVLAAAYATGSRGVSRRLLVVATVLVLAYGCLRFGSCGVGFPGLLERASGFGFARREPPELQLLFGSRPWPFYAYNVACSILTVLFSEPRAGEWIAVRDLLAGERTPWILINVISSFLSTILLARFVLVRASRWRGGLLGHDDRLVLMFLAVLLANALISFPYTKDPIMSPAGAFYAVAVFFAARDLVKSFSDRRHAAVAMCAVAALLLVCSGGWALRAAGLHYRMRHMAFLQRADWAHAPQWLEQQGVRLDNARERALVESLRARAIDMPAPPPQFAQPWAQRYVDQK
jgi:hypothetical protein